MCRQKSSYTRELINCNHWVVYNRLNSAFYLYEVKWINISNTLNFCIPKVKLFKQDLSLFVTYIFTLIFTGKLQAKITLETYIQNGFLYVLTSRADGCDDCFPVSQHLYKFYRLFETFYIDSPFSGRLCRCTYLLLCIHFKVIKKITL